MTGISFFLSDLFLPMATGMLLGIVMGVLPGFSIMAAMMLTLTWLYALDPLQILIFYVSLIVTTQFIGSITATMFGIPGEPTSLAASQVGHRLLLKGAGSQSLVIAAAGSFLASIATALYLTTLIPYFVGQSWIYSSKIIAVVMITISIYLIFINRAVIQNIILVSLGLLLGMIGGNGVQSMSLSFNQSWLAPGLNTMMLIVLAYIIPMAWNLPAPAQSLGPNKTSTNWKMSLSLLIKYRWAWLRGTSVGMIAGLIPAIGTSICSNLAWVLEKKITGKKANQLMSAESANNSAVMSSLLPVILLGLPILASEALMLEAMSRSGQDIGLEWFLKSEQGISRLGWLVIANIVVTCLAFWLATRWAGNVVSILRFCPLRIVTIAIPSMILGLIIWQSWKDHTLESTLLTVILSVPIGVWAARTRQDTLPLIFSFLIAPHLIHSIMVVYKLFFWS
jgi:putative tricarboxylic transport membrane protein